MYANPEALQEKIAEYFFERQCPTISGLAHYLGFESRQSFYDYEQKEDFTYTIRKIRLFMESIYEERLQGNSPTGAIFWLKNAGWTDKQEIDQKTEHSGSIDITWQEPPVSNSDDKGSD